MVNFKDTVDSFEELVEILAEVHILNKSFFVGGSVRDHLLRKPNKDVDIVVERLTHRDFDRLSVLFKQVGKDFPVFLVPLSNGDKIELAIARTERSNGPGHNDFDVNFLNITIEDDLSRRDLTINAMARPVIDTEKLIDPFNGKFDLDNRILRHVSEAFKEDPLRVFRVARFASMLNFVVHPSTILFMQDMKDLTHSLSFERVLNEFRRVASSGCVVKTRRFFETLQHSNNIELFSPVNFRVFDSLRFDSTYSEAFIFSVFLIDWHEGDNNIPNDFSKLRNIFRRVFELSNDVESNTDELLLIANSIRRDDELVEDLINLLVAFNIGARFRRFIRAVDIPLPNNILDKFQNSTSNEIKELKCDFWRSNL